MADKKRTILVPYDFDTRSEYALQNAVLIANRLNAQIHLISVVPSGSFFKEWFRSEKEERKMIRDTSAQLKEIAQQGKRENGVRISTSVEKGRSDEIILELAQELRAQYIVMGKNFAASSHSFFFNNQNMPIIAKAPCPVVITGCNLISREGFKNIVLPLDLTKQTTEKVKKALLWAHYYKAAIHLVGVLSTNIPATRSRLHSKMDRICQQINAENAVCSREIYQKSEKSLQDQILEHVEKVNGDLIMVMTHQERSAGDSYVGKVAQEIITKSNVPVVSYTSAAIGSIDKIFASLIPFEIFSSQKKA